MILSMIPHLTRVSWRLMSPLDRFVMCQWAIAANNELVQVKITTPSATITVRGTTLTGNVTSSGATTVTLLRDQDGGLGMVTVANRAGSVMLTQPFHTVTVASINTAPPVPTIPSPAAVRSYESHH